MSEILVDNIECDDCHDAIPLKTGSLHTGEGKR